MHRRRLLQSLVSGGILFTAGCTSLRENSDSFNFGIENWREQRYFADVVLRKNDETVFLDAEVDIPAHRPADESDEPASVYVFDTANVADGDIIDAQILIDESEFETRYEVTCTSSEHAENNLFFRIYSSEDREMQFRGSEC